MKQYTNPKLSPAAAMIIFVCVIVIFTISMLYISKRTPNTNQPLKIDSTNVEIKPTQPAQTVPATPSEPVKTSYTNPTYNFTIEFSNQYKLLSSNNDNGTRLDFTLSDWKSTMLIDKPTDASLIRDSYEIGQEDDITINGIPATRIIGSSLKDGTITYLYLITHGDRLFAFYSTSANIQAVAKTLSFSK